MHYFCVNLPKIKPWARNITAIPACLFLLHNCAEKKTWYSTRRKNNLLNCHCHLGPDQIGKIRTAPGRNSILWSKFRGIYAPEIRGSPEDTKYSHIQRKRQIYLNLHPRYFIFNELCDGTDKVQGFSKITDISNTGTWIMATMDMGS